jgi:hypothetical protein
VSQSLTLNNMRAFSLVAATLVLSSCSFFQREPPLPRHALVEASGTEEDFVRLVQDADIIYFPSEAVSLTSRSEPAWKVLAALRQSESSFALGYDWAGKESGRREFLNEASRAGAQTLELNEAGENRDQVAADKIATYFREHRGDKVFVFLRRERLALGQGVPYLVGQQTKARQLILNPRRSPSGARLLARD